MSAGDTWSGKKKHIQYPHIRHATGYRCYHCYQEILIKTEIYNDKCIFELQISEAQINKNINKQQANK